VQDRQRRKATPGAPLSPDNPIYNPVHTSTPPEPDERRRATKRPASRAPKLRHDKPAVRIRRSRSDGSRRRSVRNTSVCTPPRARRAPGHEPRVGKVTRSTCPRPGKASYAPVHECPTQPDDERTPPGLTTVEDELTNRRRTLATNGHLCVHTIGSFGLLGLGHSFHVPRRRSTGCALGKLVRSSSRTRRPGRKHRQYEYAPAYSEGPAIPTDYRE